jgi:putative YhbY family RNA-binding protein
MALAPRTPARSPIQSASMTTLTAAERKALKARAHPLKPIVMIGDAGLSPGVLTEVERGLASHELMKIRVALDDREAREALLAEICAASGAAAVQHIGKILVIWRKGEQKPAPKPAKRPSKSKPRTDPRVRPAKAARSARAAKQTEDAVSDPRRRGRIVEPSKRPSLHRGGAEPGKPRARPVKQNSRRLRSAR